MINNVYQLIAPQVISVKCENISYGDKVIVRPEYLAICHADQRYFQGKRDPKVLNEKLPMALIHECCGRVVYDPKKNFNVNQQVVLIPNIPSSRNDIIYENYADGAHFLSSGYDGFMQEFVSIDADRIVPYYEVEPQIAAITEFLSVAVHTVNRFRNISHSIRGNIGIWGDGSLAYVVANVIKMLFPESSITVIGRQRQKLSQFSFVDKICLAEELSKDFKIDHAFECCGGEGSYYAIDDVINHIKPQGTLMLMGVSENKIPINTRMILEKGITLVGCSRSGREDFEESILLLRDSDLKKRLRVIVYEDLPVRSISDIHRVFNTDMLTQFKTVFKWEL